MKIPSQNAWTQRGDSELYGTLWSSYDLDLTEEKGTLGVSPRLMVNTSTTDDADLGLPVAFKYVGANGWYAICGAKVFRNDDDGGSNRSPFPSFVEVTSSGVPTNCDVNSDMEVYPKNDDLYITVNAGSNNVKKWNGSAWSQFTAGTGGFLRKLAYLRSQDRMYMSYNVASITSWDENDTAASLGTQYTLNLGTSFQNYITSLIPSSTYLWITTLNFTGDSSRVYYWDGSQSSGPNGFITLDAQGALAGIMKDNSLWIIDTKGRLMQSNGGAFVEKARLPIEYKLLKNSLGESAARWIHPNGISIVDNRINILINTDFNDTDLGYPERAPSGVWEYDEDIGLYHKQSVSYYPKDGVGITDYGQKRLSAVGAITAAQSNATSNDNGSMLVGATFFTNASSTSSAIFIDDSDDTVQKYGSFVTQWILASNVRDAWSKAFPRIKELMNETDSIAIKYRTKEATPFTITGTWDSPYQFNTPTNLSAYIGAEVDVLNGKGGGKCAHIIDVFDNGASGWYVSLDDSFTGATGTMLARVQTWIKSSTTSEQNDDAPEFGFQEAKNSVRFQFKVCLQWTGDNKLFDVIFEASKSQ